MQKNLNLKDIFLKKIDRILNPNFQSMFIKGLFLLGISFVTTGLSSGFILRFEITYKWASFIIQNVDDKSNLLIFIGIFFVLISVYLFIKYQSTPVDTKVINIQKINILLNDLLSDLNSPQYTVLQKQNIFFNKKREIYEYLKIINRSLSRRLIYKSDLLMTHNITEKELLKQVDDYKASLNSFLNRNS